jgi:uncharacterized protein YndB with AHSA1/START domain
MTAATQPSQTPATTFTISRTYDAPRDLVFDVYNNPEHMKHWWGPKGFGTEIVKMDFHTGGICLYRLTTPDGAEMWGKLTFRAIEVPSRVSCIVSFSDKDANITTHPLSPTWPREILGTVTFTETDGKTTVTVEWTPYNATEIEITTFNAGHESMTMGWNGTFEQFTNYLQQVQQEA